MPEGDTLFKIARAMGPSLDGREVASLWTRMHGEVPGLTGSHVTHVLAVGKHLLIPFDAGWTLRTHLGMKGSWHRYRLGEPWQRAQSTAVVDLRTSEHVFVCFRAPQVELVRTRSTHARAIPRIARLGPDLLGEHCNVREIVERARTMLDGSRSIADVLLDQRIAAGIGNVYKNEVLFIGQVHPWTPLSQIDDATLAALYAKARELMKANVKGAQRVTITTRRVPGPIGPALWVYGRKRKPCLRCGAPIERALQGEQARSTYWCPRCQPQLRSESQPSQ